MSDLISKQAAIEALEEPCKVPDSWTDEYAVGERAQYEKDVKALNSLPSAERREGQPSECEYWDNESNFCTLNRPSAERHEQITSEMDEIFRIASEIRLAVGCNTSRECWELARKGDIQRVKHGRWIMHIDDLFPAESTMECDQCHEEQPLECDDKYCPACGAKMDK